MSVLILRCLLVSALAVGIPLSVLGQTTSQSPPAQTSPEQTSPSQTSPTQASPNQDTQAPGPPAQGPAAAILHAQGGVWVNGSEARDSTAIFSGDLLETKPGFSATLNLDGSELLLAPETVAKFDGDSLELDHGSVAVGTSKSFKVEVKCLTATPALSAWTQYEVSDLTGAVQVVARKSDVNVSGGNSANGGTIHEGQEKNYNETEMCGAARPASPGSGINPKWIAAGAAGAGVLIWLLIHSSGGQSSVSPSSP